MKTKLLLSFCVVFILSLSSHAYAQFKVKKEVDSSIRNTRKVSRSKVQGAAEKHYPTMGIDELCALHLAPFIPPQGICVNNAVFLGDGKPPFNVHGIMILPVRRISKG